MKDKIIEMIYDKGECVSGDNYHVHCALTDDDVEDLGREIAALIQPPEDFVLNYKQNNTDECRAAFERWYTDKYLGVNVGNSLDRLNDGYHALDTHFCWLGFQAAWQLRTPTTSPALSDAELKQLIDDTLDDYGWIPENYTQMLEFCKGLIGKLGALKEGE